MLAYQYKTGTPAEACAKMHDFGCRGVTCMEQAMIGGAAHLTSFFGTDTCPGFRMAKIFYGEPMAGFSVNATEHSIMSSRGGPDGEIDVVRQLLANNPTGLIACVGDTYHIYNFVSDLLGTELRDEIMNRDGCFSVRPDSSGMNRDGQDESIVDVLIRVSHILWDKFGGTTNAKGFNVFEDHVRAIQGDGINYTTFVEILQALFHAKWSGDNYAFGSGGGLLQQMDRDTLNFAFKAIAGKAGDEWYDIWKDPFHGGKKSKRGRQKLVWKESGEGKYLTTVSYNEPGEDQLIDVFLNGDLVVDHAFAEVRRRNLPHPREVNATSERLGFGAITADEWGDYVGTSMFKAEG
jgi:nicotinamide phosphoribosyltransferase